MKKKVFTILDVKGHSIGPLAIAVDTEDIIRSIKDALRSDNLMSRYPKDFELLELGDIDITSGVMTLLPESPSHVCFVDALINEES